jgi:hypothetical protein
VHDIVAGFIEKAAERFYFAAHHHLAIFVLSNAGYALHEKARARLAFVDELSDEGNKLLFIVLDEQTASINKEFHGEKAEERLAPREPTIQQKGAWRPLVNKAKQCLNKVQEGSIQDAPAIKPVAFVGSPTSICF